MVDQTYRVETLGCKANAYDSRRLAEALESLGYRPAAEGEAAGVCILNTCTVTAGADRKGRQLAARLVRENVGARVFVTGCYATASPGELARIPGVEGVFGRDDFAGLMKAIHGGPLPASESLAGDFGISSFTGRTRAFLKIQDGCDAGCSYCILPRVRGAPRSRPLADVRAEAERLAAAGFGEIVLTGIHLGFYGRDLPEQPTLPLAVTAVAQAPGVQRLRLSSIECNEVDEALLDAMQHPAACPHLHLPLQSGSASVLRRMRRRYTPEEFLSVVGRARERLDRPAITTDVMVGFPGETEAEFDETLEVCRRAWFSRTHVFPFSPRPGTPAAEMPGRVPAEVVANRSARVRELARRMAANWAQSFVGSTERVLFERCTPSGRLSGYTDRYVALTAEGGPEQIGRAVQVQVTAAAGAALLGRLRPSHHDDTTSTA
jgi:threonylcarbamoyladenosine tRNA methylthiotransferase MtaB